MIDNVTSTALLVIDMENGFLDSRSAHCIAGAAATVPACVRVIDAARNMGIPVFFVKRIYRANGSDVELTRYEGWDAGGRSMSPGSHGYNSAEAPACLQPQTGDYTIVKPRWSAFFHTELDLILRRLDVKTIVLIGTTTPNCIRTTAYDGNALEYNVVILEDCCSSQTPEIQRANLEDLRRMGAVICTAAQFEHDWRPPDQLEKVHHLVQNETVPPEPFDRLHSQTDRW